MTVFEYIDLENGNTEILEKASNLVQILVDENKTISFCSMYEKLTSCVWRRLVAGQYLFFKQKNSIKVAFKEYLYLKAFKYMGIAPTVDIFVSKEDPESFILASCDSYKMDIEHFISNMEKYPDAATHFAQYLTIVRYLCEHMAAKHIFIGDVNEGNVVFSVVLLEFIM